MLLYELRNVTAHLTDGEIAARLAVVDMREGGQEERAAPAANKEREECVLS